MTRLQLRSSRGHSTSTLGSALTLSCLAFSFCFYLGKSKICNTPLPTSTSNVQKAKRCADRDSNSVLEHVPKLGSSNSTTSLLEQIRCSPVIATYPLNYRRRSAHFEHINPTFGATKIITLCCSGPQTQYSRVFRQNIDVVSNDSRHISSC